MTSIQSLGRGVLRQGGFTLLELVVVIAIVGMLFQVVTSNLGDLVPARAVESTAGQLVSQIDFLRSEAKLQGKQYKFELDLENHRTRIIVPPEDRVVSTEVVKEAFELDWIPIDDRVRFAGYQVAGGPMLRNGIVPIVIDDNGATADQSILLVSVVDKDFACTIRVRGLSGTSEVDTSTDGNFTPLEKIEEGRF